MWTRSDYEEAADKIAKRFVASRGEESLNKLAADIARQGNLNPEGIRTVVRLANVSTFQEMFGEKTGSDRMIEFDLGDPERVISILKDDVKIASAEEGSAPYCRTSDYFSDVYAVPHYEKTASSDKEVEEAPRKISRAHLKLLLKEAQDKLLIEKAQYSYRWAEGLEKAAQSLHVITKGDASFKEKFAKDAVAQAGEDIVTELQALNHVYKGDVHTVLGGIKVAQVLEYHVADMSKEESKVLDLLNTAKEARLQFVECTDCLDKVAEYLEKVNENGK